MKKRIIFTAILSLVIFCFFNTAEATTLSVETTVDVPANCTVADINNVTHNYPQANSSSQYLAICALDAAVKNGSISGDKFSNFSLGLFVSGINGLNADPITQYWAIFQNGISSNFGATELPISAGDTIVFQLTNDSAAFPPLLDPTLDQVTLHINSLIPPSPVGSGGGQLNDPAPSSASTNTVPTSSTITPVVVTPLAIPTFDTKKSMDFLMAQQNNDGSFGTDLYTDWIAIALASSGNEQTQTLKLIKYYEQTKLTNETLTDYERHAMALMALGLNPYNTNGENYINDIVKSFDGKQFGDPTEDNDDIFALIVLQNAGYAQNDSIINTDLNFILSKQDSYGSWDNSVDMTGATMEALSAFNQTGQVRDALAKAENYLEQNQKADGSWNDNASSTAWTIEGILAQNEKPEDWAKNKITPLDYLATIQDTDGGVKDLPTNSGVGEDLNTKIWKTAYVTSALSGKTWNQVMQSFNKEELFAPIVNTPTPKAENKISLGHSPTGAAKIKNPVTPNTANVLNTVISSPSTTTIPLPQKNWFERLLAKIF